MKKKNQEVSKGKLKLNKERIAALTENYTKVILGGYGQMKRPNGSAVDEYCGGTKTKN